VGARLTVGVGVGAGAGAGSLEAGAGVGVLLVAGDLRLEVWPRAVNAKRIRIRQRGLIRRFIIFAADNKRMLVRAQTDKWRCLNQQRH
jgi:hypothetical protein